MARVANTKTLGELSEVKVMAALMENGDIVLKPVGDNQRYDLVLERDNSFHRIQVKTGRLRSGGIEFATRSTQYHRGGASSSYAGQAEFFGVYCPDNGKCYLVPVDDVGARCATLRVDASKNKQTSGIRMASNFQIGE